MLWILLVPEATFWSGSVVCIHFESAADMRFDVIGYTLTLVSDGQGGAKALQGKLLGPITRVIGEGVRLLSSAGAELVVQLPLNSNPHLVEVELLLMSWLMLTDVQLFAMFDAAATTLDSSRQNGTT